MTTINLLSISHQNTLKQIFKENYSGEKKFIDLRDVVHIKLRENGRKQFRKKNVQRKVENAFSQMVLSCSNIKFLANYLILNTHSEIILWRTLFWIQGTLKRILWRKHDVQNLT